MKADIHPEYREVVFQDVTSDFKFLTRSTLSSKETVKWEDGNEYPLIKVDISSASHPFYTGKNKIMDTSGRVDKFRKRYAEVMRVATRRIRRRPPQGGRWRLCAAPAVACGRLAHGRKSESRAPNRLCDNSRFRGAAAVS